MNKIYIITSGEYSDYHIVAVFKDKKKAEFYAEMQEKLHPYEYYYVDEREFYDDNVTMNEKIVKYYYAVIGRGDGDIFDEGEEYQIYTKDVVIDKDFAGSIVVSSTKSLDHAKKVAIEQYQLHTQQLLEDGKI